MGHLAFALEDSAGYLQARLKAENFPDRSQLLARSVSKTPDSLKQEILRSGCELLLQRIPKAQAEKLSVTVQRVSSTGEREYFDCAEHVGMDFWVGHALSPSPLIAQQILGNQRAELVVRVARYFWITFSLGQVPDSLIWESELGQEVAMRMVSHLTQRDRARLKNVYGYSQSRFKGERQQKQVRAWESLAPLLEVVQEWDQKRLSDQELLAFALKDDFFLGSLKPDFLVRFSRELTAQLELPPSQAQLHEWAAYVSAMANAVTNPTSQGAQGALLKAEAALARLK